MLLRFRLALIAISPAQAASADTLAVYSNGKAAPWALEVSAGTPTCWVRSPVKGDAPFSRVSLGTDIGFRENHLSFFGALTHQPPATLTAGYQVGNSAVLKASGQLGDGDKERNFTFSLRPEEFAALRRGEPLQIALSPPSIYVIDTANLAARLVAQQSCERKGYLDAGVDPALMAKVAVVPFVDLTKVFSPDDYPKGALVKEISGHVKLLAMVEPDGRLSECRILASSKSAELDRVTCDVLRSRARFEPGLDAKKRPMRAPLIQSVLWRVR